MDIDFIGFTCYQDRWTFGSGASWVLAIFLTLAAEDAMAGKITKRIVDSLEPGMTIWDSELRGFGIRLQKGKKEEVTKSANLGVQTSINEEKQKNAKKRVPTYIVYCRVGGGRQATQRFFTIGKHGSPWTPETARERAEMILREAKSGNDPTKALEAARGFPTVTALCD